MCHNFWHPDKKRKEILFSVFLCAMVQFLPQKKRVKCVQVTEGLELQLHCIIICIFSKTCCCGNGTILFHKEMNAQNNLIKEFSINKIQKLIYFY